MNENEKIFEIIYALMVQMIYSGYFDDVKVVHIRKSIIKVLKTFGLDKQFYDYLKTKGFK